MTCTFHFDAGRPRDEGDCKNPRLDFRHPTTRRKKAVYGLGIRSMVLNTCRKSRDVIRVHSILHRCIPPSEEGQTKCFHAPSPTSPCPFSHRSGCQRSRFSRALPSSIHHDPASVRKDLRSGLGMHKPLVPFDGIDYSDGVPSGSTRLEESTPNPPVLFAKPSNMMVPSFGRSGEGEGTGLRSATTWRRGGGGLFLMRLWTRLARWIQGGGLDGAVTTSGFRQRGGHPRKPAPACDGIGYREESSRSRLQNSFLPARNHSRVRAWNPYP